MHVECMLINHCSLKFGYSQVVEKHDERCYEEELEIVGQVPSPGCALQGKTTLKLIFYNTGMYSDKVTT